MQGLRTHESKKFRRYFAIVQEAAKSKNCVFFFDTGDGRDIVTDTLEGEDLAGWLIPNDKVKAFEKEWKAWKISSAWHDYFTFAVWDASNNYLSITFKNAP